MNRLTTTLLALGALAGCASDAETTAATPMGSHTVTQGGAQDIGYFRSVVEGGAVPQPETIEPVGFFAEHALDLPAADCGDSVCTHAMLAVAPGIDRTSNWTMAFIALNSPVDPRELERPDTHVVLVLEDTSRSALGRATIQGLLRTFTNELMAGDRVSVVRVGQTASTVVRDAAPASEEIANAQGAFTASDGAAALYDGLAVASQIIEDDASFEGAHRVVLLTSGVADAGVTDASRVLSLTEALAARGVGISVVGVGESYRPELAQSISEGGGGSYYYGQTPADLTDIFRLEGRTSLYPLATDFELVVEPAYGYRVGRVYGARRAWAEQSAAHLSSPVLMVGNRTGASDVEDGRRGGGGGLFVELVADASLADEIGVGAPAFTATTRFVDSQTGAPVTQTVTIENGLRPAENPTGMFPFMSDPTRGKGFMMLNMYLALRRSTELFDAGDCAQSLGIVPALQETYEGWQGEFDDPDIEADWMLLTALDRNIQTQCQGVEPQPPLVDFGCFYD